MLRRFLFILLTFCILTSARSQCTIAAKRLACAKDLVTFSISSTAGTISSYDWNFGPSGNSTNTSPIVQFANPGTVIVKCTLTLVGGGTCIDTHRIFISAPPKAKLSLESGSDSCLNTNKICFNNLSQKGSTGFLSYNLLWDDGNVTSGKAPFPAKWCHNYADTGLYTANIEIKDSAGCLNKFGIKIHVVPSVKASAYTTENFSCDSTLLCFNGSATGGNKLQYSWHDLSTSKVLSSSNNYCVKQKHGQTTSTFFLAVNEYGCFDTAVRKLIAPDSFAFFTLKTHRTCLKNIRDEPLEPRFGWPGQWKLNGKNLGFADRCLINNGKAGWNIVTLTVGKPCPSTWKDSFWLSEIRAKAQLYNDLQIKVHDTLFVMDISKNAPGSRMTRWWNFQDTDYVKSPPDTTWEKYGIHVGANANITRDSLSHHWYPHSQCPVIVLTVYDSSTNCYADTAIIVYDKEYCSPFISKKTICLGDPYSFDLSSGVYKYIKKNHYLFVDTGNTKDTIKFDGPANEYFYKTKGFKSPVFGRYYGPDTVWTEVNGKMVIRLIRPAIGWVVDTFKNALEVKYRPNPEYKVIKLNNCNPSKVRIVFKDSAWLYPQNMKVTWGDDSAYEITKFKDTIAKLDSLEHTYSKVGYYTIVVRLTPKNGCTASMVDAIDFGYDVRFGTPTKCDTRVCFVDTVREKWIKKYWNVNSGDGRLVWEFGDSTKDSGYSMCHTYKKPGVYRVKLSAKSVQGCMDTAVRTVRIGIPNAEIKYQGKVYCSEIRRYFDSSFSTGFLDSARIIKWRWDFGDGTKPNLVKNPVHLYPGGGDYQVRLIVTTNHNCKDTTYQTIHVVGPDVKAEIDGDSAGCIPLVVKFKNTSKNSGNFIWKFGDPNNSFYSTKKDTPVTFKYTVPGIYYAHLTGGDSVFNPNTGNSHYCTFTYPDTGQKQIRIVVTAGYHAELKGPDTICTYDNAEFFNLSDTTYAKKFYWDMGNGDTFIRNTSNLKYNYPKQGNYTAKLFAYVPGQNNVPCRDTSVKNVVVYKVIPDFTMDCGAAKGTTFNFVNHSGVDLDQYTWSVLNPADSTYKIMGHTKKMLYDFGVDSGSKIVCLRFDTGKYCANTLCKTVKLNSGIFLANVFTPGSVDGFNDTYRVPLHGYRDFELRIFNRWGERVFYTTDAFKEWNGKVNNTGAELPAGTYFYQLKFRDECGSKEIKNMNGSINLIR